MADAAAEFAFRCLPSPRAYAAVLYERLHEADAQGWDWIAVEQPPRTEDWAAIRDRLERAAAQ